MNLKSTLIFLFAGICFNSYSKNVNSESTSIPISVKAKVVDPVTVAKYTIKNGPEGKILFVKSYNKKTQTFVEGKNMKKINGICHVNIDV